MGYLEENYKKRLDIDGVLTPEETDFCEKHGILNDLYDARKLKGKLRHDLAKRFGKRYIIGSPCQVAGHRLRTRSGHCIQCDPSKISYQKRFSNPGILYIAKNPHNTWLKIGMIENNQGDGDWSLHNRKGSLNGEGGYGGVKGWSIAWKKGYNNIGRIEDAVHQKLKKYEVTDAFYQHSGEYQVAQELFNCDLTTIHKAIAEVELEYGTANDTFVEAADNSIAILEEIFKNY